MCITGGRSMQVSTFFFFKQKTAYEMRISDWSSDVCSSDLRIAGTESFQGAPRVAGAAGTANNECECPDRRRGCKIARQPQAQRAAAGRCDQGIADPQVDGRALAPAQQRRRNGSVDRDRGARGAGEVHRRLADGQVEFGAREHVGYALSLDAPTGTRPEAQGCNGATGGKALHEEAARRGRQPLGTAERIGRHGNSGERSGARGASLALSVRNSGQGPSTPQEACSDT